jgi:hypothetical protein
MFENYKGKMIRIEVPPDSIQEVDDIEDLQISEENARFLLFALAAELGYNLIKCVQD